MEKAGVVRCDFSTIMEQDLRLRHNHERQGNVEIGPFRCYLELSSTSVEVDILHRKTVLGHCAIGVKTDSQSTVPENEWT